MFRNLQFQKYVNSTKDIYFYLVTLWVYHDQPRRYDNHNKWRSFISLLGKTKTENLRKLFRNTWIKNNFYCIKAFWSYKPSSVTKWICFTQLFCFLSNINCQEQLKTIQQSGKNTFFLWSLHYVINCSTGVSWQMARKTNIFQLTEIIKVQHVL